MKNKRYLLFIFVLLPVMTIGVLMTLNHYLPGNSIDIIIASASIVVTTILGIGTYRQMNIQIALDKQDKTPFYRLIFNDYEDDVYKRYYMKNSLPLIRTGDTYFVDFEFANEGASYVSSIVMDNDVEKVEDTAKNKLDKIVNQEEKISEYVKFLKNITPEQLGDGLIIFQRWKEIDTGKNTNYDERIRELILHLYYYYNHSFAQLTVYRNPDTTNDEREELLKKIISDGPEEGHLNESYFDFYTGELNSITHQMQQNILRWTENIEEIEENMIVEDFTPKNNLITNTQRFHQYIPIEENIKNKDIKFVFIINTVYGYKYKQTIDVTIENSFGNKLNSLPDENNIINMMRKVEEYKSYKDDSDSPISHYEHEKMELNNMIKRRGSVFVTEYNSHIEEL